MPSSLDHKKIIFILFFVAIIFLLANIVVTKITHSNRHEYTSSDLSGLEIDKKFIASVRNFGIDTSWIRTKKTAVKDADSLFASYIVDVPRDLPIALLLREISNAYDTNSVSLNSIEKKIAGRTVLEISSGSELKLLADFNYKEGINRKAGIMGFMLEDFNELGEQEDSVLLYSPEAFAVILVPSKENAKLAKRISESGKEYIILLNDNISELDYKLNPDYSEKRLKSSIRSILGDFGKAVFIMLDENSGLYSSSVYPLLKAEMEKRKIKIENRGSFRIFSDDNPGKTLRNFLHEFKDGEEQAIIISAEDYTEVNNVVISFRKIGYKFVAPSVVIM